MERKIKKNRNLSIPRHWTGLSFLLFFLSIGFGCSSSTTNTNSADSGPDGTNCTYDPQLPENCATLEEDYIPRDSSELDIWPQCISDDHTYHLVELIPSSAGRVAAFEQIATLLFGERKDLTTKAFTDARFIYDDQEGLGSRVRRREDEHYPKAVDSTGNEAKCGDNGVASIAENFHRCVGPTQILPLLTDAFSNGQKGIDMELNAARIEAGLLWFLFTSTYKEAVTCKEQPRDCDSSWAYYTGGTDSRCDGIGLSRYVDTVDQSSNSRAWDGILALRCWRDLLDREKIDSGTESQEWHNRALAQIDRSLIKGFASIVADKTKMIESSEGIWPSIHFESLKILGPVLFREAHARDSTLASQLEAALDHSDVNEADMTLIRSLLDQLFPCP